MKPLKTLAVWSGFVGILYLFYWSLEALSFFTGPLALPLWPPADVLAGSMLIIVGSILLYRIKDLMSMKYEGLSFLAGGLVLSGILGIMFVLIALAKMLNAWVVGEAWSFDASYNLPAIVLAVLLLPGWICIKRGAEFCE
jgi:hypothetical protein